MGIDAKLLDPRAGGIGRYAGNLVRALLRRAAAERLELVLFTGPRTRLGAMNGHRFETRALRSGSSLVRALFSLPVATATAGLDLFHGLDHVGLPLAGGARRRVVTVHDLLPLELPALYPARHRLVVRGALRRVLTRADRIIVPSHAVRRAVVAREPATAERVRVIPEGRDERFTVDGPAGGGRRVRERYGLPQRYVLFVGNREPRKNLGGLLAAFARLRGEPGIDPGLGLVIAGAPSWGSDPAAAAAASGRVVCTGFVPDDDLPDLYRGAELLAHPALSEGFGLTVLEAMACGTPVVCSDAGALPEVAGDAALLVDPRDPPAIAGAAARLLRDPALRRELRRRGLRRARSMSWDAAARRTVEVYRELLPPAAEGASC